MRLLQLSEFYPVVGGTAVAATRFAKALASHGIDVEVFAPFYASLPYEYHQSRPMEREEELGENLKVHRIEISKSMILGAQVFSQFQQVFRRTMLHPPDVVLAFTLGSQSLTAYLLKQAFLKRPQIIGWGRGSDVLVTPKVTKGFHGRTLRFVFRRILKRFDLIFVQNSDMKRILCEYGVSEQKMRIVPNFLPRHSYPQKDVGRECREVVYCGGARPEKGTAYLVEAMKLLPHLTLRVIGGWGPYGYVCKAIAGGNVQFKKPVAETNVPDELVKSDIFCLPSLTEGFPNVLLEAMACGMPIVASDIPAIRELAQDSAILVPPKDSRQIADGIRTLAENSSLRRKFSMKAIERSLAFTEEKVMEQLLESLR